MPTVRHARIHGAPAQPSTSDETVSFIRRGSGFARWQLICTGTCTVSGCGGRMNRLDPEARRTIKTLAARAATNSHIARLLGVTEGAIRHHVTRLQAGARDGRSRQEPKT